MPQAGLPSMSSSDGALKPVPTEACTFVPATGSHAAPVRQVQAEPKVSKSS